MKAEDVANSTVTMREVVERLEALDARLDDIVGMLGEVFDQMHPCQECVDSRAVPQNTATDRRHLTLTETYLRLDCPCEVCAGTGTVVTGGGLETADMEQQSCDACAGLGTIYAKAPPPRRGI